MDMTTIFCGRFRRTVKTGTKQNVWLNFLLKREKGKNVTETPHPPRLIVPLLSLLSADCPVIAADDAGHIYTWSTTGAVTTRKSIPTGTTYTVSCSDNTKTLPLNQVCMEFLHRMVWNIYQTYC